MGRCLATLSFLFLAKCGASEQVSSDSLNADLEVEALSLDDVCSGAEDQGECALHALQLRGVKVAADKEELAAATEVDGIWHYALPCAQSCKGYGYCSSYCGPGNACCIYGGGGPPECQNVGFWPVRHIPTCVTAAYVPPKQHTDHSHNPQPFSPQATSCASKCNDNFDRHASCQCNSKCEQYQNCCGDYHAQCETQHAPPAPPPSGGGGSSYKQVFSAEGSTFFDGFTFLREDTNHGSAEYLDASSAFSNGVIEAHGTHAIMRAGRASPQYQYKRQTVKIASNQAWKYFLMTMKYSHVPWGCGVWPALFTLAPGAPWPDGGETDIIEFVNDGPSQSSFHTASKCTLNSAAVNKYGYQPDKNKMNYDCYTNYPKHLGCAPNKWVHSGASWANTPGVVAMEWTEDFLKLFFIPEHEIPAGEPRPETWDRWLFSYYPFKESGCHDVMQAQQIVMQIGFCGDWASKVWDQSASCKHLTHNCRSVDPLAEYAPQQDCCTQFIWDQGGEHGTDNYLAHRAFFNISYMKIYQQR